MNPYESPQPCEEIESDRFTSWNKIFDATAAVTSGVAAAISIAGILFVFLVRGFDIANWHDWFGISVSVFGGFASAVICVGFATGKLPFCKDI